MIWKKNYATIEDHPWIWNADCSQLIISESNDYYITGQAEWPTNNNPGQGSGLRSFFIKVDEEGNEEWLLPFGIYDDTYGRSMYSFQINDTLFLGIGYDLINDKGLFIWYSDQGQVYSFTSKKPLGDEYYYSQLHYPILQEDNTLWCILIYKNFDGDDGRRGYIHIDTAFNVLNYMEDDRWGGGRSSLIPTYNNKFITVAAMQEDVPGFIYDIYISKRNEDYSFDTVYSNWPGSFDSLCPHAIESGYIDYECETIIVGTEEIDKKPKQEVKVKITPNPAKNKVNIAFENNIYKELKLQIFNINGEEIYSEELNSYPQSTEINIGNLSKGVYLVAVRHQSKVVAREKLVVE